MKKEVTICDVCGEPESGFRTMWVVYGDSGTGDERVGDICSKCSHGSDYAMWKAAQPVEAAEAEVTG